MLGFLRWDGHRWYQPRFDAPINVRVNAIDLLDGKLGIKFGGWAVADNGNAVAKWDGAVDYWSALHACYGTYYRMRDTSIVTSTVGIFEWDAWAVGTSWPDSSPKQADYFLRYMDGCSTGYAWQAFQSPRACEPNKDDGPKETYLRGIQMMPGSWGYAVGNYKDRASIYSYDESSGSWSTDWCEPGDSDYRPSRLYTAAIVEESGVGWFGGFYTSPVTKRKVADIRFNDALGLHWGVTPFPINGRNIYHRPILRMDMSSDTMGWAVGDGEDSGKVSVIYQYPYPNFTLDLTPDARALIPGNTTTFTVTVNSIGGFSADVSLSVSNLPEGISVDIDPDTVNEGTSGIITVQTSPTTTLGTYEIPLLGYTTFRSGDNDIPVWRTTYLLLTVTNTPVYAVSPSSGPAGTDVTIKGENFGLDPGAGNRSTAANHVILAGQQMPNGSILSWSDNQIEVEVPDDASLFPRGPEYGEVSVTAGGSKSNTDFSFQLENYIEDISMQVDGDEIVVDLTGTSFGDDPGGQLRSTSYEHVALSDEWLPTNDVLTWSNNTVQFTVHISTTSGLVAVTSNGFESNSVLFDNPVIERESYDVYLPLTIND